MLPNQRDQTDPRWQRDLFLWLFNFFDRHCCVVSVNTMYTTSPLRQISGANFPTIFAWNCHITSQAQPQSFRTSSWSSRCSKFGCDASRLGCVFFTCWMVCMEKRWASLLNRGGGKSIYFEVCLFVWRFKASCDHLIYKLTNVFSFSVRLCGVVHYYYIFWLGHIFCEV